MNLSSRDLKAVIALVEERNFTRAARRVHLSQPAFSALIQAIEAGLGARLFDRSTRNVVPTPEGRVFEEGARRMLVDFESMVGDFRDHAHKRKGRVAVAALPSLAAGWLPQLFAGFHAQHPAIELALFDSLSETCLALLRNRQADFAFASTGARSDDLEAVPLCSDRFRPARRVGNRMACHREAGGYDGRITPNQRMHTRDHLLHLLAEAAELEHNILCTYLYAAFSLKREQSEGLTAAELARVDSWRKALMSICVEEMTHLAQVANLMVAVGARPHFNRPNFPVGKGYHPAAIELALAPFDLDTLEHFIFLERPERAPEQDAKPLGVEEGPERPTPSPRALMPSAPDYETIGEFYAYIRQGIVGLSAAMGEQVLFCGPAEYQMRGEELKSPDLLVVRDLASATAAIDLIVVQGEGSPDDGEESHYRRLSEIKQEYLQLQRERAEFLPHRPVARNPVMRAPHAEDRVHVTAAGARQLLDAANGAYAAMLATLGAVFDTGREQERAVLIQASLALMHTLGALSDRLTRLPASRQDASVNAGVTFTMARSTEGTCPGADGLALAGERLGTVLSHLQALEKAADSTPQMMDELASALGKLQALRRSA